MYTTSIPAAGFAVFDVYNASHTAKVSVSGEKTIDSNQGAVAAGGAGGFAGFAGSELPASGGDYTVVRTAV